MVYCDLLSPGGQRGSKPYADKLDSGVRILYRDAAGFFSGAEGINGKQLLFVHSKKWLYKRCATIWRVTETNDACDAAASLDLRWAASVSYSARSFMTWCPPASSTPAVQVCTVTKADATLHLPWLLQQGQGDCFNYYIWKCVIICCNYDKPLNNLHQTSGTLNIQQVNADRPIFPWMLPKQHCAPTKHWQNINTFLFFGVLNFCTYLVFVCLELK